MRESESTAASSSKTSNFVALLRGINVGGNKILAMAELRSLAEGLGFLQVRTYIQSGNLLFATELGPAAAERVLERAIQDHFPFTVPVIVRSAAQCQRYASNCPFRQAARERPNLLLLGVSKQPIKHGAAKALREYAKAGERIETLGDAVWIDYRTSVASSKLTPAVLDRCIGSTVTARNLRTLQRLTEMLQNTAT